MPGPRRLVDWPWVTVEVECPLCSRFGRYRLARLAERVGSERDLGELLLGITAKCGLPRYVEQVRQYEARCGARYRVPAGGPLPDGVPAREVGPKEGPPPRRPQRRGPDGPLPTIRETLAQGLTRVRVSCLGLYQGHTCHHSGVVPLDALRLPDDVAFIEIPKVRRLRCSRCGARDTHVMPDWAGAAAERAPRGTPAVLYTMPSLDMVPRD